MGNAAIGLADEIETVYYNPAGLGNLVESGVTAMYQAPELETSRSFAGFNVRFVDMPLLKDYLQKMVKMSPLQGYSIEIIEDEQETRVIGAAVSAERSGC